MTNDLEDRSAAARAIADLSADELVAALLSNDAVVLAATSRFTPAPETLDPATLRALLDDTEAAIAKLETRLREVAAELDQLPRRAHAPVETGSQIDVSG